MKRKITNILSFVIVFSIGVVFGELLDWGYFELTKDISLIDALTLFTTLGIAIYITRTLEKEVNDGRIEKDLFLAKISEIELTLDRIEDIVEEKDCAYNKVNNRIHSCRKIKNVIFQSISDTFSQKTSSKLNAFEPEISSGLNSLKRLLTETPISESETPQITLENGRANYSMNRLLEIDVTINSIKENLFKLKVKINSL